MEKIEINLDKCKDLGITGIEYVYLWYLCNNRDSEINHQLSDEIAINLVTRNFIIVTNNKIIPNVNARKLIKSNKEYISNIEEFAKKYQNLFPKGIKSGGKFPIRSNLNDIIEKFKKFFELYPNYTQEEILAATKLYLQEKERDDWKFVSTAVYFILKQDQGAGKRSYLASYCDMIRDKEEFLEINEQRL